MLPLEEPPVPFTAPGEPCPCDGWEPSVGGVAGPTVSSWDTVLVSPALSLTVSVTSYVPEACRCATGDTPLPVVPSPKSQL